MPARLLSRRPAGGSQDECQGIGKSAVRIEMPEEGKNKLSSQKWHKKLPAPFIIYANFEALTTKINGPELDPNKRNTQTTQQHKAHGLYRPLKWGG